MSQIVTEWNIKADKSNLETQSLPRLHVDTYMIQQSNMYKILYRRRKVWFSAESAVGIQNRYFVIINCDIVLRNPNEAQRQESVLPISRERNRYKSIQWDEYDTLHQKYLEIGEHSFYNNIYKRKMLMHKENLKVFGIHVM